MSVRLVELTGRVRGPLALAALAVAACSGTAAVTAVEPPEAAAPPPDVPEDAGPSEPADAAPEAAAPVARPDDGVKNGDETDVDCGGAGAPRCAVGKLCAVHGDCAADACSYAGRCVAAKSCAAHFGGDTCGSGDTGAGAQHESCCTEVAIADRAPADGGPFAIDKFHVTAGRMRAFLERWSGNLTAWAAAMPPGWNGAWTSKLPRDWTEARGQLGPWNKRGCSVPGMGGRTFWQAAADLPDPAEVSDHPQDVLDEKALNCVPWHMAMALCVSDGRRLANVGEVAWEFENRGFGGTLFPWGDEEALASRDKLVWQWSYETPVLPANARMDEFGPLDRAYWMAPPGRRPLGASRHGVMDIAGNMLHWIADGEKMFTWTMSWERHGKQLVADWWDTPERADGPDGYYALGARCARSL